MLMQIGQKPESTFHEPIEMMEDCHKRFFFFLNNLIKVAAEADPQPLDPGHRVTIEKALRYFRESAPLHNSDEEQSLFPRLRKLDAPGVGELLIKIDSLQNDHRWAEKQHQEVDAICRRWLATGALPSSDRAQMTPILQSLLGFYQRHIQLEESEVFSLARKLLSESGKASLGEEMARRRGLNVDGTSARVEPSESAAENRAAAERMRRQ